jgi:pimeloyl-ACP methyl ester carboxylesterase
MPESRICLIHGAATTAAIWDGVAAGLATRAAAIPCVRPERAASGSLDTEVTDLVEAATGALVVGVSGGATLGLELAARGVGFRAAILHEPAVGSLLPGLLDAVAAAYGRAGVSGFATTLYGPGWRPEFAPPDPDAVARDLAMFRTFEPRPPAAGIGPILITVGADSPPVRHDAARRLADRFGYEVRVLPGCGHALHIDSSGQLVELIAEVAGDLGWTGLTTVG